MNQHKHKFRVQGRTIMGWQYKMRCDCGHWWFPAVQLFGAVRISAAIDPFRDFKNSMRKIEKMRHG